MSRITTSAGSRTMAWPRVRSGWAARVADYIELTKPRIVVAELVTVVVAAHMAAAPASLGAWMLINTVVGAALVAASAGAFNQWWEQTTDARMERTARRPLPTARLQSWQVLVFGTVTLVAGAVELAWLVGYRPAIVGLATWLVYVLIYTPLKSRTPLNTAVGAVSGALPVLIGWTAAGAAIDLRALSLVGVMFLWQFPHFMSIAWIYRDQYVQGGQRMLTVVDPTGRRAGIEAVVGAVALVPVSLLPALLSDGGSPVVYCLGMSLLGVAQVVVSARFLARRDDRSARLLLRATLLYLTCWMGLLVVAA